MEEQSYGRSFPGCMKGLMQFFDLHHRFHLRKMKMLMYRSHGEGKRAGKKEPKTDPDSPSTSHQYLCFEDTNFMEEDKFNTRKHQMKSSRRIFIPRWGLRDHNNKRKSLPSAPRLLRTLSIHHWREDHVNNMNFGVETSVIEHNVDVNIASSRIERVHVVSSNSDEQNFDEQCDDKMIYNNYSSLGPSRSDEVENILQMNQLHQSDILSEAEVDSLAQKDANAEEQQKDVILHPSKEFLAMMKLFNGNTKLIQNILDDPSFLFAHYLRTKQASNAELTRTYSFPLPWQLKRKIDGKVRINHKIFEIESLVKQSNKFHPEDLPTNADKIEEDEPKEKTNDGDEERTPELVENNSSSEMVATWSTFNHPNTNRSMSIRHNKKEHHHIFMDGILHKIPFEKKMMEAMKKSKSSLGDGSNMKKAYGEGSTHHSSWNMINKNVKKNIQRSQSFNEFLDKYSNLYESISKEEFKGLSQRMKVKSLGRIFSLPHISSKNAQSESYFSSFKSSTSSHIEKILKKEESKELTTEVRSTWSLQSNENEKSESCQVSEKLTEDGLTKEEDGSFTPQGEKLWDEAYTYELTVPTIASVIGSHAQDLECKYPSKRSNLLNINAVDGLENNERDVAKAKSSPDIDCSDVLHLQIDPKEEAKFNFVREILNRSGFSINEFLEAWRSPHLPMDLLLFNEEEDLSYELDIVEDEHDVLQEHQLLVDLINEALMELCEKSFGSFFPWLSRFNTNTRPMLMGSHIMEDQPQLGRILEEIVSRNITENDGWMNIQFDIEDVVCELENLLLDALLDDVVGQLSLLPPSSPISC